MLQLLQTADLAENCFLSEVLYWLGLHRLPLASYGLDGDEFRFSREVDLCVGEAIRSDVSEGECESAGLPLSPKMIASKEDKYFSSVDFYDRMLEADFYDETQRRKFEHERAEAINLNIAQEEWELQLLHFLEYYKAKLFIALREGKIKAKGIKVEGINISEIRNQNNLHKFRIHEQQSAFVPQEHWILSKIDWFDCLLYHVYFHIAG